MGDRFDGKEDIHDFRLLNEKLEEVDRSVVPDSVLAKIAQSIFSLKLEKLSARILKLVIICRLGLNIPNGIVN